MVGSGSETKVAWHLSHLPMDWQFSDNYRLSQVITSMSLPSDLDHIVLLASSTLPQARGAAYQRVTLVIPRIKAYFTGTGE